MKRINPSPMFLAVALIVGCTPGAASPTSGVVSGPGAPVAPAASIPVTSQLQVTIGKKFTYSVSVFEMKDGAFTQNTALSQTMINEVTAVDGDKVTVKETAKFGNSPDRVLDGYLLNKGVVFTPNFLYSFGPRTAVEFDAGIDEAVTVPAGTFSAKKVKSQPESYALTNWYANKILVKLEAQSNSTKNVYELVSAL